MTRLLAIIPFAWLTVAAASAAAQDPDPDRAQRTAPAAADDGASAAERVAATVSAMLAADLAAMQRFRPGYRFWNHVFTVPDGSVAFGSATDGRLLAVLPASGSWTAAAGRFEEPELAQLLDGVSFSHYLTERREEAAAALAYAVGPIVHNPTRGRFLMRNVPRYSAFLDEWGRIYERFGVPAELGLAQAIIESGLDGRIRSEANAIGLCQWLHGNWQKLARLAPHVIEANNQTTQAPFCAAYLTVLATKYGSFLPALSEHHAGGANVGRAVILGARLGADDIRARYFIGAEFALDLRRASPQRFAELYRTYGPRSFRYTELVFGNMATVTMLRESTTQRKIHAMRTGRAIPIAEITRRTGLSADEVRRYNPALVRQVPRNATLYLPTHIAAFGSDVAFWHRPAPATFTAILADFLALDVPAEYWDEPAFQDTLATFQRRFRQTRTEEGTVMAVTLAYVAEEMRTDRRGPILQEYRTSPRIANLIDEGMRELGR
jgi:hypothetical protein